MDDSQNTERMVTPEAQGFERLAQPDEPVIPEPVFTPFSLTVGDGFKFGCGFTMAVSIALMIALLALSIFWLAASVVGVAPPLGR